MNWVEQEQLLHVAEFAELGRNKRNFGRVIAGRTFVLFSPLGGGDELFFLQLFEEAVEGG